MKCKVENCENEIFAKQLCKKHYFRFKRHGDTTANKKGRKPNIEKALMLKIADLDVSKRTQEKYWYFLKNAEKLNLDAMKILQDNLRPNGSFSFSLLENIVKSAAAASIIENTKYI